MQPYKTTGVVNAKSRLRAKFARNITTLHKASLLKTAHHDIFAFDILTFELSLNSIRLEGPCRLKMTFFIKNRYTCKQKIVKRYTTWVDDIIKIRPSSLISRFVTYCIHVVLCDNLLDQPSESPQWCLSISTPFSHSVVRMSCFTCLSKQAKYVSWQVFARYVKLLYFQYFKVVSN